MQVALCLLVALLYASGFYLLLRRTMVKLALGLLLLSHASNLLIFVAAGLRRDLPPLLPESGEPAGPYADPVPQALVLTAIVISFGVLAFFLALVWRVHGVVGTDDLDRMVADDERKRR